MEETSKKVRHTPGPWTVIDGWSKNEKGEWIDGTFVRFPSVAIVKNPRYTDGKIVINVSHDQEIESLMANARLIAAAPSLLEALEKIDSWLTDGGIEIEKDDPIHKFIINAIKLAKGEIKTELI